MLKAESFLKIASYFEPDIACGVSFVFENPLVAFHLNLSLERVWEKVPKTTDQGASKGEFSPVYKC